MGKISVGKIILFFPHDGSPIVGGVGEAWANIGWFGGRQTVAWCCLRPHSLWGAPILHRHLYTFCKIQVSLIPFQIHVLNRNHMERFSAD